ncbi:MAG TPA: DUF4214 domain-containing protein [Acidimicrobiales bacterium]|nr:DUF4214 domain-containing protein [Acidimicrobiales bacterium]
MAVRLLSPTGAKSGARRPSVVKAVGPTRSDSRLAPGNQISSTALTWTGDAPDSAGLWSEAANWSPAQVPANGDSLAFPSDSSTILTAFATNDLVGLSVANITMPSGGAGCQGPMLVDGNSFTLTGAISADRWCYNAPPIPIDNDMVLGSGSHRIDGVNLVGAVSGSGSIIFDGSSAMSNSVSNTYSGGTLLTPAGQSTAGNAVLTLEPSQGVSIPAQAAALHVPEGDTVKLESDGAIAASNTVIVDPTTGTSAGTFESDVAQANSSLAGLVNDGYLALGDGYTTAGQLALRSFTQGADGVLGDTSGEIIAAGPVSLAGGLQLVGLSAPAQTTVIQHSSGATTGTFSGMPPGSALPGPNNTLYTIRYNAGAGADVSLTQISSNSLSGADAGTWAIQAPMPSPRLGFGTWSAVTLSGTPDLLTLGGTNGSGQPTTTVDELDAGTPATWAQDAALPVAMRFASAATDPAGGIELAGITGSPSSGESLVVLDAPTCAVYSTCSTSAWQQVTSYSLGQVTVAGLTASRAAAGQIAGTSLDLFVHLDFFGCASGAWYLAGDQVGPSAGPGVASYPGPDPAVAGALWAPDAVAAVPAPIYEIGGIQSNSAGVECSATKTANVDDPGQPNSSLPSVASWPDAPGAVNQLGSAPAAATVVDWTPSAFNSTSEHRVFLVSSPSQSTIGAAMYDIGSLGGTWEADPPAPLGCNQASCPQVVALAQLGTSIDQSVLPSLAVIASDGTTAVFGPAYPGSPPANITIPSHVTLSVTVSGRGSVISNPAGINCVSSSSANPTTCTADFPAFSTVALSAASQGASIYDGMTMACASATCASYANNGQCSPPGPGAALTSGTCAVDVGLGEDVSTSFLAYGAQIQADPGQPTGTKFVNVLLSCSGLPAFAVGTYSWIIDNSSGTRVASTGYLNEDLPNSTDAAVCPYAASLVPGQYSITLNAQAPDLSMTVTATAQVTVYASIEFTWNIPASSSPPVPVTIDACAYSSGIQTWAWSFQGQTQSAGCDVQASLPTGEDQVTLIGTDTSGHPLSVTGTIDVYTYSNAQNTSACPWESLGGDACWREFAGWTGDILSGSARWPDFIDFTASVTLGDGFSAGAQVDTVLTCDGNWYNGDGVVLSAGLSALPANVSGVAAVGWIGDPTASEPLQSDVDGFIVGATTQLGVSASVGLTAGANFITSPGAPGPKNGVAYFAGAAVPGFGINAEGGASVAQPGDTTPPGDAHCGPMGVFGSPQFQQLLNVVNPPNLGYQSVSTSGGSSFTIQGAGQGHETTVYVQSAGWAPGSVVSLAIDPAQGRLAASRAQVLGHSVALGSAVADDTGSIGQPELLPGGLTPGTHDLVLTGYGPDLSSHEKTISFVIPGGGQSPVLGVPTDTVLTSSLNPVAPGHSVTYTASVSPATGGGRVVFTDGGAVISGCESVPVDPTTGQAVCPVTYDSVGTHPIGAAFSGFGASAASAAPVLTETVSSAGSGPPATSPCGVTGLVGNQAFLCQTYEDLLGRLPDAGGLAHFGDLLASGTSRTQIGLEVMASPEYRSRLVGTFYQRYLGRAPDTGGSANAVAKLVSGATDEQVIASLVGSPEFLADAGGSNAGFVSRAYSTILSRPAHPGGAATFLTLLSHGVSRTAVALDLMGSAEYRIQTVVTAYLQLLDRLPDAIGLASQLQGLSSGGTDEQLWAGIIGSNEYLTRSTGSP